MEAGDERLKGKSETNTLGYQWNLKKDTLLSTMEPTLVSKKRGMSRNQNIRQIRENPELITRRALSVLCASIVSTDGVLSAPLQLGAKLLLSRAAVLCPGGV